MTTRMLPPVLPLTSAMQKITVNGRSYSAAAGSYLDVPDTDAVGLQANGWTLVALVGTTAARPTGTLGVNSQRAGTLYLDTTLTKFIISDGVNWRDPTSGTAV
jgi:hypothetical protein